MLAATMDHTFLRPYRASTQTDEIVELCAEARKYGFATVMVHPCEIERCQKLLEGSTVGVGTVVGFPLGQNTTAVKVLECRDALLLGATDIDMVLNVRALQSGLYDAVQAEIKAVVKACREYGSQIVCKVILETCYLTNEQKIKACEICKDVGVDFVKTSTGFGTSGATVEDVALMKQAIGSTSSVQIKASGEIRNLAIARAMIKAGATRLGVSSSVSIIEELLQELGESSVSKEDTTTQNKGPTPSSSS